MDISIIVPLYKGRKYIHHIIKMILENQKVLENNVNVEIIFINDFPSENIDNISTEIDENISVKLYKNSHNLGIHESRLIGLSKAKGLYIVFLDQDDEISSSYLCNQLNYIGKADAVLCNGIYRENKLIYKDIKQQQKTVTKENFLRKGNYIVSPGQVMIKKSSIPKKWKENILKENGSDDALLWILMLCEGKKFALNPYCEYIHTENGTNASLEFIKMKNSSEEILKVIEGKNLLKEEDFGIFEEILLERVKKHNEYAKLLGNWDAIFEKVLNIYIQDKKKKVAVYGFGVIGKKLVRDLENVGIRPDFIIDRDAENYKDINYKVFGPELVPKKVDLIIITPLFAEKQIKKDLEKYKVKTVSLKDMFIYI